MNRFEKFIYLLVFFFLFLCSCDLGESNNGCIWKSYEVWPPENVDYILNETLLYSLRHPGDHRESPGIYILNESYFDYKAVPSTFWLDCESSLELERSQVDDFAMSGIFRCDADEDAWRIVVCVYNKFDRERRYEATYRYDEFRAVFFSEMYEVEGRGYFMPPGNLGLCRVG